ncbi:fibrous sheath-interacting protein 2-like [Sigmodon hispidus]
MDLYLNNCLKAAEAAASKAASGNLKNDKETCKTKTQKPVITKIGPSSLLDLPLGAKLPVIPGSTNIFYTTNISEKLYQPSFGFNLSDPYCKLMETTYKSLHDPHLKSYFKRKDILKRLKQDGYITGNNKVICSLKELNKYRQYLTTLKIDFERNYIREQKIIESQINKLNEERRACDDAAAAEFQQWLLQEGKKPSPHQDRIIKLRHLRMIKKELDKIEDTLGRRNTLQLKEEDRQHWDNVRIKLSQCKQVEEKQAMLHKRIAYHLQKLQNQDSKEEKSVASVPESTKQPETASSTTPQKLSLTEQKTSEEHQERKSSTASIKSISDQRLLEESRESKSASQATKASFDEEKSSFYELLKRKFRSIRRSSLPEEQMIQELLEPKHNKNSAYVKKTSFAEQTMFHEPAEQKYGPATAKRASLVNQKLIEDLLEAKLLLTKLAQWRLTEDNLEPKCTERLSISLPPHPKQAKGASRQSLHNISKQHADTHPQNTRKQSAMGEKKVYRTRRRNHHEGGRGQRKVIVLQRWKIATVPVPELYLSHVLVCLWKRNKMDLVTPPLLQVRWKGLLTEGKTRKIEYLVRWKGYESEDDTWEPEQHLVNCEEYIHDFNWHHSERQKEGSLARANRGSPSNARKQISRSTHSNLPKTTPKALVVDKDHESKNNQLLATSQKFRKNIAPSLANHKNIDLAKSGIKTLAPKSPVKGRTSVDGFQRESPEKLDSVEQDPEDTIAPEVA